MNLGHRTGLMVSTANKSCLKNNFPRAEILSVEHFMGNSPLNLKAANKTNLNVEGVVIFRLFAKIRYRNAQITLYSQQGVFGKSNIRL